MTVIEGGEILVVELLGGFGDVLLALPAVHALARRHPTAAVRVLTFAPGDALLQTDPHVAEVIPLTDHGEGAPRAAVAAQLSRRRYDLVVTTTRYDGIGELCAAGAVRAVTDLWRRPPADERVDRRFLALLHAEGVIDRADLDLPPRVHLTGSELARGQHVLAAAAPGTAPPVVFVPDAGMPVKRWPEQNWSALAAALPGHGLPVLALPPPGRPPGLSPVPGADSLPPADLRQLAALLAAVGRRGGVVVGGDTGPVRLATAVGARAVGLYGPTSAGRYGLDPRAGLSLQGLPDCPVRTPESITEQECWWSARCPLTADGPACMAHLGVDTVLASVLAALRPAAPVP